MYTSLFSCSDCDCVNSIDGKLYDLQFMNWFITEVYGDLELM